MTVRLLHTFRIEVDDERIGLGWSAQRLVAFLALKARPLSRAYVAGALWPDTTSLKANANLRTSLWRVQRAVAGLIDASPQQLSLSQRVLVDVHRARAWACRLLDPASPLTDILSAAIRADLSADILPDWYNDDWILIEHEQFHQLRLYALEALCERLTAAGRHREAVDAGLAAVRAEPLRESAHQALVKAHLGAGNRWEAIRQYERCRYLLLQEMGLEPSAELRRLLPLQHVRR